MGRYENVAVFRDTEHLVKTNEKLKASVKTSTNIQKVISEEAAYLGKTLEKHKDDAKLIVSKKRTYEAASAYKEMKIAVHNFASATNPGGGVVRGASAQEECLCRCSTLYFCLDTKYTWDWFYTPHRVSQNPLHNDDIIYTPYVTVFKTDTASPARMPESDWYQVDVITCAAPNLRERPSNRFNSGNQRVKITDKELLAIHEKRLSRILDVAVMAEREVVILGAFGCGAFMNRPEIVAQAAKNVIKKYKKAFKVIEFAVYCGPRDETNYKIFSRVLKDVS